MAEQEIVQALRCCGSEAGVAAANMIENLTKENTALRYAARSSKRTENVPYLRALVGELRKEIEWKDMVIALAQKKQAEAEAERDALIEQIKERHDCIDCRHNDYCEFDDANVIDCMNCVQEECPCASCCDYSRWDWKGLPEAPEEGET